MTDRPPRQFVLHPETGSYRLQGGLANLVANSAAIASAAIYSPNQETVIIPQNLPGGPAAENRATLTQSPRYNWAFIAACLIFVGTGLAELLMSIFLKSSPTGFQQTAFGTMDTLLKASGGAILGLIGGKVS
jgi:hypothetical protein